MKSELDTAWTMVMSWTPVNRRLSAFFKIPFKYNSPQNEDALNWDLYRLSLARMRLLQTHSTHWRATCSYPTHGIDFRDYLLGISLENASARTWNTTTSGNTWVRIWRRLSGKKLNTWTLHTDSTHTHSQFKTAIFGAASSEDNFGWYGDGISNKFSCPQGD